MDECFQLALRVLTAWCRVIVNIRTQLCTALHTVEKHFEDASRGHQMLEMHRWL
jgi:hypothetical protein